MDSVKRPFSMANVTLSTAGIARSGIPAKSKDPCHHPDRSWVGILRLRDDLAKFAKPSLRSEGQHSALAEFERLAVKFSPSFVYSEEA